MGQFDENADIYKMNEDLLYFRTNDQPKKEKLHFESNKYARYEIADVSGNIGSNCWVVHGNHTESGKPMLACDPHLVKWMQSKWYLISLRWGDGYYITGGSTPGIPAFTYARTKFVAWGATALNPDANDIFVEKVDGDKYFYENEWHKFKKVTETFKVRFGSDVVYDYNYTHNGVMMVVPDEDKIDFALWQPLEFMTQNENQYSWRWAHSETVPLIFTQIKDICEKNYTGEEFLKILDENRIYALNLVFVNSRGDIGYKMTGTLPKKKYNVGHGVYPKKGWLKENQWDGLIDNSELPGVLNPL